MGTIKDMTGERFSRLAVLRLWGLDKQGKALWECRCDCGNLTIVSRSNLITGSTKSCGCWRRERPHTGENVKHGGTGTRLHRLWRGMKQRCYNPNAARFNRYGGRGITICPEWLHDFAAFRDWALSHGYQDDLTIDRIDNDQGYSPDNCRWVTMRDQVRNRSPYRRPNHKRPLYEIDGMQKTAKEWAD